MKTGAASSKLTRSEIEQRVQALAPWFQNMDLSGVKTAPDHFLGDYPNIKWRGYASALPRDMRGQSVLDIGCNAGFFSLEMKRRGASRVVGIDSDARYLEQARFAAEVQGETLELQQLSVYEVAELKEQFDWVLFTGVLYHLRYPMLALDLIRKHVVRENLVFQSMLRGSMQTCEVARDYPFSERAVFDRAEYPRLHFVEQRYSEDPTNWWIPNRAAAEGMLRSAGFTIVAHPEAEVYVCKVAERAADYPECELRSRTAP